MKLTRLIALVLFVLAPAAVASPLNSEQMQEDLRFLRDVWSRTDHSLSAERRPLFEEAVAEAIEKAPRLTPAEFTLEVSRAVAIAGNGHSEAQLGPHLRGLPIGLAWFSDELFVIRTEPRYSGLLGARVEKFGSLSTEQAVAKVSEFIAGNAAKVHANSASFLRILEVLHYIGAARDVASITLGLRMPDGKFRKVQLHAESAPDPAPQSGWMGVVVAARDIPGRWAHVLDRVATVPAIYRDVTALDREWLQGDRVVYIRSNQIFGSDANRYELFANLLGLLQVEVAPRRPKYAIVDLRLNHGGDFFNTVSFAQALPRMIPAEGKIFVLVGPDTFSAALVTAAMLKGHGGARVVLVGEPMGDEATFWAEGTGLTLPNSKLVVGTATKKQNWGARCTDTATCYWGNIAFGFEKVSLEPEIKVATTFAEYAAGRDAVLETVLSKTAVDAADGGAP